MSEIGWKENFKDTEITILAGQVEPYQRVLDLQRDLNNHVNEKEDTGFIILCEHQDVYTCGIHTEHIDDRIKNPVRIERGGSITYHGPGQIIAYYILNMKHLRTNILGIIENAHLAEIDTLYNLGVQNAESRLGKETGIWVGSRKIGSTGFAIKMNATLHGTALNIEPDLDMFSFINPCGFEWEIMTSVQRETGKNYIMDEVRRILIGNIIKRFEIEYFKRGTLSAQLSGTVP
jgi:lipoyl(octanoyl) transferase